MPVFRVERWLPDCLDSILTQDFHDIEVVVVDDSSPDRSRAIAEAYAERDPRVRVVGRPNGGIGAARNTGVREAVGRYLTFVDSDDLLPRGALGALVSAAKSDSADLVVGAVNRFDGYRTWDPDWVDDVHARARSGITLLDHLPLVRNFYTWDKLVRREFWDACGVRFREGVAYEDQPLVTQLLASARRISVLPQATYTYRLRPDRSSTTQQVGTMRDLRHRIEAWRVSRDVLVRDHPPQVYDAWLSTHVSVHFHSYLGKLLRADEEYWQALHEAIREFTAGSGPEAWAAATPERRVHLELVRQGRHADARRFIADGGRALDRWPAKVVGTELDVTLPLRDDPSLPEWLFRVQAARLRPVHHLDVVRWTARGLEVCGAGGISMAPDDIEPVVTLVLVNLRSGEHRRVPTSPYRPVWEAPYEDQVRAYPGGGFRALVPPEAFAGGADGEQVWRLELLVAVGTLSAQGPVSDSAGNGRTLLAPVGVAPGWRARQDPSAGRGIWIRVEPVAVGLSGLRLTRRGLRGKVSGPMGVRRLAWERGSGDHAPPATASVRRGGRFLMTTLPRESPRANARLFAESHDGRRTLVGPEGLDWLPIMRGDDGGALVLERTPAGGLSLARTPWLVVVDGVADAGQDILEITGRVLGAAPESLSLRLARKRQSTPWTSVTLDGDAFVGRVPMTSDLYRFRHRPLPSGDYRLWVSGHQGESGRDEVEPRLGAGLHELPRALPTPTSDMIATTGGTGRLRLVRRRPLGPARGKHAQARLRAGDAAPPSEPGVLLKAGDGSILGGCSAAVHAELRERGWKWPIWWAVADPALPVPDDAEAVVVNSQRWYDVLGSATHYLDEGLQPRHHRRREWQQLVKVADLAPPRLLAADSPVEASPDRWSASDEWTLLVSPGAWATPALRAGYGFRGEVIEGWPAWGTGSEGALAARVRDGIGVSAHQVMVLTDAGALALLGTGGHERLPSSHVLVVGGRWGSRAMREQVIEVPGYPIPDELLLAADLALVSDAALATAAALAGVPVVLVGDDPGWEGFPVVRASTPEHAVGLILHVEALTEATVAMTTPGGGGGTPGPAAARRLVDAMLRAEEFVLGS